MAIDCHTSRFRESSPQNLCSGGREAETSPKAASNYFAGCFAIITLTQLVQIILLQKQAIRNKNDVSTVPLSLSSLSSWIKQFSLYKISETVE